METTRFGQIFHKLQNDKPVNPHFSAVHSQRPKPVQSPLDTFKRVYAGSCNKDANPHYGQFA